MTVDAPAEGRPRAGRPRLLTARGGFPWLPHLAAALALVVLAGVLRAAPLGASSLWLDDAWVALVSRADSLGDLRLVSLTAPGFSLVLAGWMAATGGSAAAAQLLPFLFAAVAPGALYLVAARRGAPPVVAGAAGAFLAVAPLGIDFATRVKQYSLDALLGAALLGLGWWVAELPDERRRWAWLTGAGVAAMVLTAGVVPVALGALAAGGLAAWRGGSGARRLAVVSGAVFAGVGGAWWALVLRPAVNDALRTYWEGHYLQVDDGVATAVREVPRVLGDVLAAASPLPVWASAVLLAGGVTWLALRRRLVAALVVVPLLVGLVLAALQLAPLGGGRTDHHLFPVVALGMAFALEPTWRRRSVALGVAAALAVALAVTVPAPRPYPQEDLRPLVERLERELRSDDTVLVYPSAVWAYALYADLPIDVVADPGSIWRWRPEFLDPRVAVLRPHRDEPERYGPEVAAAVADAGDTVWLVASHHREDIGAIEAALRAEGLAPVDEWRERGARITRWER